MRSLERHVADELDNGADGAGKDTDTAGEKPEYVSEGKLRNIVAGMLKSSQAKVSQDFSAALDAKLAEFAKSINGGARGRPAGDGDDGDGEPAKKKPAAGKPDKEPSEAELQLSALQKKLEKLEEDRKKEARERAKERQQAIERGAYADLKQSLAGKVRAEAIDAVADLVRGRGLIGFDAEGNPLMKVTVSHGKDFDPEEMQLPIAEAIPHYLKSAEARLFLPPPQAGIPGAKPKMPGARPQDGKLSGASNGAKSFDDALSAYEAMGVGSFDDNI